MPRFHTTDFDFLPEMAFRRGHPRRGPMTLEGGKGDSMPPPDPRLIEAQITSLGVQDEVMREIMAMSRDMAPLQREQMQFGIDAARVAHQQAQEDRDWAIGRRGKLADMQDRLIADASTYDSESRRQELAGQAMADVNQAFDNVRGQNMRQMTRMGINPNDGRMHAVNAQTGNAQALAMATAANAARQASKAEGIGMTDRAVNALAGYPAMGMQATGAGAGYGAMGLGLANQGLAGMTSGLGTAGGMAGSMGANATSMYGTQANAYMQDQNAQAAGMGALGSAVGGVAMAVAV